MDQVIIGLFAEVRRHKPSVIYIPNVDAWYTALSGSLALMTFMTMLKSIPSTDQVLLLATAECEESEMPDGLIRNLFGFSHKNRMDIPFPDMVKNPYSFIQNLPLLSRPCCSVWAVGSICLYFSVSF